MCQNDSAKSPRYGDPETETNMIVLIPAYGRDYGSQADALKDFNDNKDFEAVDVLRGGGYTNKADLEQMGVREVAIRYKKQRMKFFVRLGAKQQSA